jgi:hypothetical protein
MAKPQKNIRDSLIALAIIVVFSIAVILAFNIPASPRRLIIFIAIVSGLVMFSRQAGEVTVGFVIVTTGVIAVIVEYLLPGAIIRPFQAPAAVIVDVLGFDPFATINALDLLILSIAFVAVMRGLVIRLSGRRKFLDKVADLVLKDFARYWRNYVTVGRLLAVFAVGLVAVFLGQAAEFAGTAGDLMAQAPFFVSNVVVGAAGYLSLGGELPVIGSIPLLGSLTASEFAILFVAILFVAAAVARDGSGPLANFLENR